MDEHEKIVKCWESKEKMNFDYVCERIRFYIKKKELIPNKLQKGFKGSLTAYTQLLDLNGFILPSQKYPYKFDDPITWRYINVRINDDILGNKIYSREVKNKQCIYNFGD
jgi:hypothetical protein